MIQVDGVSKEYRSGRGRVLALSDVSFAIETGKAVALAGKSGSGKTTLLNCVGGLERPEKGRVTCFGTDMQSLSERALSLFHRHNIGFVFQHGNLLTYLTVSENIAFPLMLNNVHGRKRDERVKELLARIFLSGCGAAFPHELSGGEVQRVAVARALGCSWPTNPRPAWTRPRA